MTKLRIRHILFAVACSAVCFQSSFAQDLDDIIRVAGTGDNMITSGMGKMEYERKTNRDSERQKSLQAIFNELNAGGNTQTVHNTSGEYEFAFEGDRYAFINRILEDAFMEDSCIFNGDSLKTVTRIAESDGDTTKTYSIVTPTSTPGYIDALNYPLYHSSVLGEPVAMFLERDAAFLMESMLNDIPCLVFEGTKHDDGSLLHVWLGPADLYHRPVRIEELFGESGRTVYDIEYAEHNGMVSVAEIIESHYSLTTSNAWELYSISTSTMLADAQFNIDIPDDTFELVIPPGAIREPWTGPVFEYQKPDPGL